MYALSKGLAEDVAYMYRDEIPIVVIRPSIVFNAISEPMAGWVEGISSGATGIICGSMTGLIRTMYCGKDTRARMTPVDFVANATIVSAYKRSVAESNDILFYNCTDCDENPFTWFQSMKLLKKHVYDYVPHGHMLWFPNIAPTSNFCWHLLSLALFQFLPAIFFDIIRALRGKKML